MPDRIGCGSDSRTPKSPEALRCLPLVQKAVVDLSWFHTQGPEGIGCQRRVWTASRDAERSPVPKGRCWSTCGRTHAVNGKPFTRVKTREITKIAIGIECGKLLSAPRRRNRVRARYADGR
ncbi:hypothetical protein EVAR_46481_1 [Eumeta japonica]|uniref:Uncharacterized protein n=1 Tax=Eumeta variegata TaxID=151549 RepID=A0A4C1WRJ3_EUMVA|nr:hypothetical protein EVAR_46481_1 [Eumeta japonica]